MLPLQANYSGVPDLRAPDLREYGVQSIFFCLARKLHRKKRFCLFRPFALRPTIIVPENKTGFFDTLAGYWLIFERNLVGLAAFAGSKFKQMAN